MEIHAGSEAAAVPFTRPSLDKDVERKFREGVIAVTGPMVIRMAGMTRFSIRMVSHSNKLYDRIERYIPQSSILTGTPGEIHSSLCFQSIRM